MSNGDDNPMKRFEELLNSVGDLMSGVDEFVDEHEESIKKLKGESEEIDVGENSLLKRVEVEDDEVEVSIADLNDPVSKVSIEDLGNKVRMTLGDDDIKVNVPDDANVPQAESTYNNGVLTLTIPRNGGG